MEGWKIEKILEFFAKYWSGEIHVILQAANDESYFSFYKGKIYNEGNPNTYNFAQKYSWVVKSAKVDVNHAGANVKLIITLVTPRWAEKNGYVVITAFRHLPPIIG